MAEWKLFPDGTVPECTTPEWYAGRARAPHLEEPGQRERLHATARCIQYLAKGWHFTTISDLGCGDGGLLSLLPGYQRWGYDISPEAVRGAHERGVEAAQLDVIHAEPAWGDLSVATEMLEHLVDPHGFVRRIRGHSRFVVASSPWTESDRSHYEFHVWAWDHQGYRLMFEDAGWRVLRQETIQSFQILVAESAA